MRSRPSAESPTTFTTSSEVVGIGPFHVWSTVANTCFLVTTVGGSDTQPLAFRSWLSDRCFSATFDYLRRPTLTPPYASGAGLRCADYGQSSDREQLPRPDADNATPRPGVWDSPSPNHIYRRGDPNRMTFPSRSVCVPFRFPVVVIRSWVTEIPVVSGWQAPVAG
jgi:hypothetical protein